MSKPGGGGMLQSRRGNAMGNTSNSAGVSESDDCIVYVV